MQLRQSSQPETPSLAEALEAIFEADQLIADEHGREETSRSNIPLRRVPDFVVYPKTAEQVRQTVLAAGQFEVPIWPVSRGKNWGYGCKTAYYGGGMTMILERMDRVIEIDEELGYAVVEPGVSYAQLNELLKGTGSRLWADSSGSTKDASVIGNALDRGRGLTPYADHLACLCGMDVVLPNGEMVSTGGGPQSGCHTTHVYKWGTGPYVDGLFSQSNMGIVVKAGVWLMPRPAAYDFFVFEYTAHSSDFDPFLATLRELLFSGAIKAHPHLANDFAMLCIVSQYPNHLLAGRRCLTREAMASWRKEHGASAWTFGCGLYGSRAEVRHHKRIIKRQLSRFGRVVFAGGIEDKGFKGRLMLAAARGVLRLQGKSPSLLEGLLPAVELFKGIPTDYFAKQVYFKSHATKPPAGKTIDPARDGCGFIWIGPVVPFSPRHVNALLGEVIPKYERYEFDHFVEVIIESPRSLIVLFGIFYDKQDAVETQRAEHLYEAIREAAYRLGYPPYRASVASTTRALDENPPLKDLVATVKQAVDPRNILAPGRYGTPAWTVRPKGV